MDFAFRLRFSSVGGEVLPSGYVQIWEKLRRIHSPERETARFLVFQDVSQEVPHVANYTPSCTAFFCDQGRIFAEIQGLQNLGKKWSAQPLWRVGADVDQKGTDRAAGDANGGSEWLGLPSRGEHFLAKRVGDVRDARALHRVSARLGTGLS